jgi:hypothetical protein
MRTTTAFALTLLAFAGQASADAFYPATRIQCDPKAGTLKLVNAGAYNEAGIRKSDAKRGIYTPNRGEPNGTEVRCDTPKSKFVLRLQPVLDRHATGDTFRVSVTRNGKEVLEGTLMDDDRSALQSSSFVVSITIAAAGEAKVERSCQAQVPMALKCGAGSPAKR